jgi:hypothetical protein
VRSRRSYHNSVRPSARCSTHVSVTRWLGYVTSPFLLLNKALLHGSEWEVQKLEMNGRLHVAVVWTPGKDPLYSLTWRNCVRRRAGLNAVDNRKVSYPFQDSNCYSSVVQSLYRLSSRTQSVTEGMYGGCWHRDASLRSPYSWCIRQIKKRTTHVLACLQDSPSSKYILSGWLTNRAS